MPSYNYKCKCNEPAKKSIVRKEGHNKGREFYACAKEPGRNCNFFKWENKNSSQSQEDEGPWDGDGVLCVCGGLAQKFMVKKDGPNKGRYFYGCPKAQDSTCKFFQWVENVNIEKKSAEYDVDNFEWDDDDDPGCPQQPVQNKNDKKQDVVCVCGDPARQFVVKKEGANKGRSFYGCPRGQESTCGFFQWVENVNSDEYHVNDYQWDDDDDSDDRGASQEPVKKNKNESGEEVVCVCGEPARKFVVKKEGANKGRSFYGCPRGQESTCGFFQWADIDVAARKQPSAVQQPENNFDCQWDEDDWGDDQNRPADQYNRPLNSGGNQVRCICGQPARKQTVQKDGPNKGKEFYTCSKDSPKSCGFFDWAQDYSTRQPSNQQPSPSPSLKKPVQLKKGTGVKKYGSLF
ncbi:uncharacterized protein LOC103577160 [Microplitis demolitor]|uniref:uncharacterized protein LOC103577160 n=1 Tax=Microplitis demolitor TaxID=69319 RepID=UPI0004CD368C|nr:uncharacterized protein LOC103577160 [Microplitis demolitor]